MTRSLASPEVVAPRRADPRASFLVMVGWYAALVVLFNGYVSTLSGAVPAGCDDGCDSDRSRMLLFGLYSAAPALFLALPSQPGRALAGGRTHPEPFRGGGRHPVREGSSGPSR